MAEAVHTIHVLVVELALRARITVQYASYE
jgi:hypothetical protein